MLELEQYNEICGNGSANLWIINIDYYLLIGGGAKLALDILFSSTHRC